MRHSAIHGAKREFMTKSIHDALHQFIQSVALLRLWGFLHAFHLVEMTIPPKNVISTEVLSFRGLNNPKNLLERSFILVKIPDLVPSSRA